MVEEIAQAIFTLFVGVAVIAILFTVMFGGNVNQVVDSATNFIIYGFVIAFIILIFGMVLRGGN